MNHRKVVFVAEGRFKEIISSASLDSVVKHFPVKYLYSDCDEYSVLLTYMDISQIYDNKTQA